MADSEGGETANTCTKPTPTSYYRQLSCCSTVAHRWNEADADFEATLQEAQALEARYAETLTLFAWGPPWRRAAVKRQRANDSKQPAPSGSTSARDSASEGRTRR